MFITNGLQDFVGYHEYKGLSTYNDGVFMMWRDFLLVFGYGYGYDPWVRVVPNFPDHGLAYQAARQENWMRLARYADSLPKGDVVIGDSVVKEDGHFLRALVHVEFGQRNGILIHEPVYKIQGSIIIKSVMSESETSSNFTSLPRRNIAGQII